jgi:L-lactate utilization protein LutC
LQIDVPSDELIKILKERLEHHKNKADTYEKKAKELGAQIAAIEEDMEVGKVSGGTPVEQLSKKAREHRDQANWYTFMIDHVVQKDTYRLDQRDLQRLGIAVGNHYY